MLPTARFDHADVRRPRLDDNRAVRNVWYYLIILALVCLRGAAAQSQRECGFRGVSV